MKRWTHGHSAGTGFLLALSLLGGHYLWGLTAALLVGFALGRGWGAVGSGLHRLGGLSAERLRLERERWLEVRARRRRQLEASRSLRADRERIEREAYRRGVVDGADAGAAGFRP